MKNYRYKVLKLGTEGTSVVLVRLFNFSFSFTKTYNFFVLVLFLVTLMNYF